MGSLCLHPYFNSLPLPPHSSALSSSFTNWSRHLAQSVRIGGGLAVAPQLPNQRRWVTNNVWESCTQKPRAASIYLYTVVDNPHWEEPKTKVQFPTELEELECTKLLAGGGAVKKRGGLLKMPKNVYTYAFGLYAKKASLKKQLNAMYENRLPEKLEISKEIYKDVLENYLDLTVRLQIVEIDCFLSAFEKSIGSRLQNFSGTEKKEILKRFTYKFNDDCNLKRGTKIDFVRDPCHNLLIIIDGKRIDCIDHEEMGSTQLQLLCRCLFDLYIGEDPVDKEAKKKIGLSLASWLEE